MNTEVDYANLFDANRQKASGNDLNTFLKHIPGVESNHFFSKQEINCVHGSKRDNPFEPT